MEKCTSSSSKPLWYGAPRHWRKNYEEHGSAFKGKTIIIYLLGKTPPKEVLEKIIIAGEGKPLMCTAQTKLKQEQIKAISYAVIDQDIQESDEFIRMLKKNDIPLYRATMLLDMFTMKPPFNESNYRMFSKNNPQIK